MTGFLKTWQYFAPKSAICTLISQLKITPSDEKKIEEDKRVEIGEGKRN